MHKRIVLFLILLSALIVAFVPLKKRASLADVAWQMLNEAYNNPGVMQVYQWKRFTLYLERKPTPDYLMRQVYRIGVSTRGKMPTKMFNLFRKQFPPGCLSIDGFEKYSERDHQIYFIWDEIVLFDHKGRICKQ